jgi:exodeoxyribonuclease VII small subunit
MSARKNSNPVSTFEDALQRLEEIVRLLEDGALPLEESLRLYEEGIGLSKTCADRLAQAEVTLKRLAKDMEGNLTLLDENDE